MLSSLTPFQQDCLTALARFPNGHASADEISRALGRGLGGRLAVVSALRALLTRDGHGHPDVSDWVVRLAPRDRWSATTWCIGKKARAWLKTNSFKN